LQRQVIEQSDGAHGLRDQAGLEFALAQLAMSFGGANLYPDVIAKASASSRRVAASATDLSAMSETSQGKTHSPFFQFAPNLRPQFRPCVQAEGASCASHLVSIWLPRVLKSAAYRAASLRSCGTLTAGVWAISWACPTNQRSRLLAVVSG
jgi:hypothetical protein